jgi:hypothetical protein
VSKENRFREYTRAVWRQGYEAHERQPAEWRAGVTAAIDALVAELRTCASEEDLHTRYWEPGDWPADVLRRHLPRDPGPEVLLELEDACFWLRCRELQPEADPPLGEAGG